MASRHEFQIYLRHDLKRGLGGRWIYFLVATALFALVCGQLCQRHHQLLAAGDLAAAYAVEPALSLGDYWCYLFRGTDIFVPGDTDFRVNMLWVVIQVYLAFMVAQYPFEDLAGYGQQLLLRAQKRTSWWLSKCVWITASVAVFYIVAMATILVFGVVSGAAISLEPHVGVQVYFSNMDVRHAGIGLWLTAVLLPFTASLSLSLVQMALSLLTRPLIGLVAVAAALAGAIFYNAEWLTGNYLMLLRVSLVDGPGLRSATGFLLSGVLIVAAVAAGIMIICKKDILSSSE